MSPDGVTGGEPWQTESEALTVPSSIVHAKIEVISLPFCVLMMSPDSGFF
jgi:hypothetical protein